MRFIVNADDLGASPAVNESIFGLMESGGISSATILANANGFPAAASRTREFPHCSFGVHLNASEHKPLTNSPGLRPILDESGAFAGNRLREVKITASLRTALFQEWCAQVERVQGAGVPISHLDSHHHMHTVAGIFPVLKQVQRRFGIRKVRQTMNIYHPTAPASKKLLAAKALWSLALRNFYATKTTDAFTSLYIFVEAAKTLRSVPEFVELMVHPGDEYFALETEILGRDWWCDLPFPATMMSYNEL